MGSDKYVVEGSFEAQVVHYIATSKTFPLRFIEWLSPDTFSSPYAQLFVELIVKYYQKKNRVPAGLGESMNLVSQWHNRGKITKKVKAATIDYLHDCSWAGAIADERETSAQFADLMRSWLHYRAAHKSFELAAERKPLTEVADLILAADGLLIDNVDTAIHANVTDIRTWVNLIKTSGVLYRMPTGVTAWDSFLDGGLPRGTLGIVIAPTGGGKSITLSQMCASALMRGQDAAYISLEIDQAQIAARILAPIAGLPIDLMIKRAEGASAYLESTFRRTHSALGNLYLEHFPEGITAHECLSALDKRFEADAKKGIPRPKNFYFDYLDRFGGGKTRGTDSYSMGRDVTQTIRNYIAHWEAWGWSACQSKRFVTKASYRDSGVDDVADSMHKVRISDIVINILFNKDGVNGDEIASRISKHRNGKSGQKTPFQPVDFKYGIVFDSPDFITVPYEELAYDLHFSDLIDVA